MSDLGAQLRLAGRDVLLVGGPAKALGLVGRLLDRQAAITVVAPSVATSIQDLAERGALAWHARTYAPADLTGIALVVACPTGGPEDEALERVRDDADRAGILVADLQADTYRRAAGAGAGAGASPGPTPNPSTGPTPGPTGEARTVGSVTLVGGGPGDPGLLTLAGVEAVRDADVVVVDRLAPLEVLRDLGPHVQVVDVAKIPRGRFTPQERINEVLLEHARAGRKVVRLKGGDPFVFGRGMEEVLACREAGVPVDVIPGVTSAVAAPALAGVPVTHRGLVQGFAVISGHAAPDDPRSTVDWASLAASGVSIVVLMGVETLPRIATALVDAGREADTPVACIMDAATARQRVATTTLGHLSAGRIPPGVSAPAVTVVGAVAQFAGQAGARA